MKQNRYEIVYRYHEEFGCVENLFGDDIVAQNSWDAVRQWAILQKDNLHKFVIVKVFLYRKEV